MLKQQSSVMEENLSNKPNLPEPDQSDQKSGLDEPLTDPSGDLLDMNEHALALAKYLAAHEKELPFTVGIFGEWGEGKTTMVHFLEHHLTKIKKDKSKEIKFVKFSAWPFTTSEKLWRGLILKIVRVMFNCDPENNGEVKRNGAINPPTPNSGKLTTRVSTFLHNDFFKPPPSDFEQFVKALERTEYGKISKRTPTDELDQETMLNAVVAAALTVLGTVAPFLTGFSEVLGFRPRPDGPAQQTEESSTADALREFRELFGKMLKSKAGGEAVYVFIDDLDRAQPDVALDIMESIRIALSNVDCMFIIAVDETLISQGLRLRYRELFAEEKRENLNSTLANKGQEYLEKIIQFRTRVPPRTAEQTKRLIAAEFADWTPAGDIIQTIANNNPRRIKQYCQRLVFQKDLGSSFILGSPSDEKHEVPRPDQQPKQ
jgi:hypothetical protein